MANKKKNIVGIGIAATLFWVPRVLDVIGYSTFYDDLIHLLETTWSVGQWMADHNLDVILWVVLVIGLVVFWFAPGRSRVSVESSGNDSIEPKAKEPIPNPSSQISALVSPLALNSIQQGLHIVDSPGLLMIDEDGDIYGQEFGARTSQEKYENLKRSRTEILSDVASLRNAVNTRKDKVRNGERKRYSREEVFAELDQQWNSLKDLYEQYEDDHGYSETRIKEVKVRILAAVTRDDLPHGKLTYNAGEEPFIPRELAERWKKGNICLILEQS